MKHIDIHKARAFTLSELLVAMVTSLIIIGLCFVVIRMIDDYFFSFRNTVEIQTQHLSMEYQLWKDFNQSDFLELKANRELLLMGSKDTIVYQFLPEGVVRQNDSLSHYLKAVSFYYKAIPVNTGPVDAVEYSSGNNHEFHSFIFRYPSIFDINSKPY